LRRIITLTTDFGTKDGYIGAVQGVILSINPQAQVMDITHQIPAQNIRSAALCILNYYSFFPEGTIHLAVVDPGVGGPRKPILIQSERYFFMGPDNGIFSLALQKEKFSKAIHLKNPKYFLGKISPTFHGRDIFAPVAAYLSLGVKPEEFGPRLSKLEKLKLPAVKEYPQKLVGEIIHIDNFGNLVTNVRRAELGDRQISRIKLKTKSIQNLSETFSDVKPGEGVAYVGSSGYVELGINRGNAAIKLKAKIADKVEFFL